LAAKSLHDNKKIYLDRKQTIVGLNDPIDCECWCIKNIFIKNS